MEYGLEVAVQPNLPSTKSPLSPSYSGCLSTRSSARRAYATEACLLSLIGKYYFFRHCVLLPALDSQHCGLLDHKNISVTTAKAIAALAFAGNILPFPEASRKFSKKGMRDGHSLADITELQRIAERYIRCPEQRNQ